MKWILLGLIWAGLGCQYSANTMNDKPTAYTNTDYGEPLVTSAKGERTVEAVVATCADKTKARFARKGQFKLPEKLTLIGYKKEALLEVWGWFDDAPHHLHTYAWTAQSGVLGPKLREGDGQIPEGIYKVAYLNPNSSYHVSFKIDYPNAFDLQHAQNEGRDKPGTDIFIHGSNKSIGCIAIGDAAIEELFTLVAMVSADKTTVIIAPNDIRGGASLACEQCPSWVDELHAQLLAALQPFR